MTTALTVAAQLSKFCVDSRACAVFAVCGGGSGLLYSSLAGSTLPFLHCRREDACVYAAIEASLASDRPAVVCVTSGEAVAKAMSAMASARAEGAWLLLLSGCSDPHQFGRAAIQPTDPESMPSHFYGRGPLLDCGRLVTSAQELPWLMHQLSVGFQRPQGFVAHLAVPRNIQRAEAEAAPVRHSQLRTSPPAPAPAAVAYCADALVSAPFATLVGFGARRSSPQIAALIAATGARALTTPRGKGIVQGPCVGLGGTRDYYPDGRPDRLLVLGTRLGEASTGWDPELLPREEILHVDVDPACFGMAYQFPLYGVHAEVGLFLDALLSALAARGRSRRLHSVLGERSA